MEIGPTKYEETIHFARRCAEEAVKQGALAPWEGDMLPGDLEALRERVGEDADVEAFAEEFRKAIDAFGV